MQINLHREFIHCIIRRKQQKQYEYAPKNINTLERIYLGCLDVQIFVVYVPQMIAYVHDNFYGTINHIYCYNFITKVHNIIFITI